MLEIGDIVQIYLRNEQINCAAEVIDVNPDLKLPIKVKSAEPFTYFNGKDLYIFSIDESEIVSYESGREG